MLEASILCHYDYKLPMKIEINSFNRVIMKVFFQ